MWKTTTQTALIALSLVTFGTGCDLADLINNIGGGGGVIVEPMPVPEPTPVPVPDDCESQLDQCLQDIWGDPNEGVNNTDYWDPTTGPAEEACFAAYDVCIDVTLPPPPPTCETELDDCLASIYTLDYDIEPGTNPQPMPADLPYWDPAAEQACYEAYDDCTGNEPPPPPYDDCELELDRCLQDIWIDFDILPYPNPTMPVYDPDAEQACFDQYAVCIDDTFPPPPPVDACEQLFTDCIDNGVSFGLCEQVLDECVMNQEPPCPDHDDHEPGYPGHDDGDDTEPPLPPMP